MNCRRRAIPRFSLSVAGDAAAGFTDEHPSTICHKLLLNGDAEGCNTEYEMRVLLLQDPYRSFFVKILRKLNKMAD